MRTFDFKFFSFILSLLIFECYGIHGLIKEEGTSLVTVDIVTMFIFLTNTVIIID